MDWKIILNFKNGNAQSQFHPILLLIVFRMLRIEFQLKTHFAKLNYTFRMSIVSGIFDISVLVKVKQLKANFDWKQISLLGCIYALTRSIWLAIMAYLYRFYCRDYYYWTYSWICRICFFFQKQKLLFIYS